MPWATVAANVRLPLRLQACDEAQRGRAVEARSSASGLPASQTPIRASCPAA